MSATRIRSRASTPEASRAATPLALAPPVIFLILAATAIPVEFRTPGTFGYAVDISDVLSNIMGYLPVGFVLGGAAVFRTMAMAAAISLAAETSQLVMMHRDPSLVDVAANVIGAAVGALISARVHQAPLRIRIDKARAAVATLIAAALALSIWATAGPPLSPRGVSAPGELEGRWTFDEPGDAGAPDSSGHGARGTLRDGAALVAGEKGRAVALDGVNAYVDVGDPSAFRLVGSLTLSAWFKAAAFPVDDAVIVSTIRHIANPTGEGVARGFQLDTTVDRGPRTIGFKVADACGALVMRYGATPLELNRWYHVAAVYDADARTMDVYLNGKPDNGFLRGQVTRMHRASREPLAIGKRRDLAGFAFSGAVDDVRVYSSALTQEAVAADMRGEPAGAASPRPRRDAVQADGTACSWSSEREDARIPVVVAAVGVLIGIACLAFTTPAGPAVAIALSALAGLGLLRLASPTLPPLNLWLFPLTCAAGALSVIAGIRDSRHAASGTVDGLA